MPVSKSPYEAPSWARGADLQTILPAEVMPRPKVVYRREIWDTPDGDIIATDWITPEPKDPNAPVMVHLHGLEGSSHSHYAEALMAYCRDNNMYCVVVNYRSCGGILNKNRAFYTAADDKEWDWVFKKIRDRFPKSKIFAMGASLGANNLLHWLGTRGEAACPYVVAAVSVSNPFVLKESLRRVQKGFSKIYEINFVFTLKRKALEKLKIYPGMVDEKAVKTALSMREFDDAVTAPLSGFRNAIDYYYKCSCKRELKGIRVPTLVINAINDPIVGNKCLPTEAEVSDKVILEYSEEGGHCGFPIGSFPGNLGYLPKRTLDFCKQYM